MPQARLPDINSAFQRLINKALSSLESENYTACIGSLNGLNALLSIDYRVQISDKVYKEKTQPHIFAFCRFCTERLEYNDLKINEMIVTSVDALISGQKTEKVWVCTKCGKENRLVDTKLQKVVTKQPAYFGVVPYPPQRRDGLMSRSTYKKEFKSWFWLFFSELQERMAQFRDDNWKRPGALFDDNYGENAGEEFD